ncbi:MAG: hypothetical protein WBA12_15940 [Catalinimonas sp.]
MERGYACINFTLGDDKVTVSRSMACRPFDAQGQPYVSELIVRNFTDLPVVFRWRAGGNRPEVHYSESRSYAEQSGYRAHAELIARRTPTHGPAFDVVIEAEGKERTLLHYRKPAKQSKLALLYPDVVLCE